MLHGFPQGANPRHHLLCSYFHLRLSATSGRAVSWPHSLFWRYVERTHAMGISKRVQGDREGRIPEEPELFSSEGLSVACTPS